MRKSQLIFILMILASLFLTTSCSRIPEGAREEFTHWSDRFFVDQGDATLEVLKALSAILVACAGLLASFGLIANLRHKRSILSGYYLVGMSLMIAGGLLVRYIPIASSAGRAALGDLTLDQVAQLMSWDLSLNPVDMGVTGTAIGVTMVLPVISAIFEILMTALIAITLLASIFSGSVKGVVFTGAQLAGWVLFLWLYRWLILSIGEYYGTGGFIKELTEPVINGLYIAGIGGLLGFCYLLLPTLAANSIGKHLTVMTEPAAEVPIPAVNGSPGQPGKIRRAASYVEDATYRVVNVAGEVAVKSGEPEAAAIGAAAKKVATAAQKNKVRRRQS